MKSYENRINTGILRVYFTKSIALRGVRTFRTKVVPLVCVMKSLTVCTWYSLIIVLIFSDAKGLLFVSQFIFTTLIC